MNAMFRKISVRALVLVFGFFVFTGNGNVGFAIVDNAKIQEMKDALDKKIGTEPIVNCKDNLFERYDIELVEFLEFIDNNFQNKSANSSLVNIAISRYAEYKITVDNIFASIVPGSNAGDLTPLNKDELQAYSDCSKIKESYLELGKKQMIEHIKNTTAQKRATILSEKYKAINDRLRDLNFSIARMYGYFKTFGEKLPFFVANCITK